MPVITTKVGGLAEVVKDGITGYLVPPEDPSAVAAAVRSFYRAGGKSAFATASAANRSALPGRTGG